jgi:nitronate monooxygenase
MRRPSGRGRRPQPDPDPRGEIQGLIHDIPNCADLVSRIVAEAETIIQSRLESMVKRLAAVA